MQVKVFKAYKGDPPSHLENEINAFLEKPFDILEVHTRTVDAFLYVLIEYEEAPDDEF